MERRLTGIVKGYEIKKNRDGSQNVLMLQVEISGSNDPQSVEYMSHAGDDHIPPVDSIVTILEAGRAWKIAIASNDGVDFDSSLSEGERKLYAPGGASIIFKDDGTIEINGNADNAVSFADLQTALNNFKTSIDAGIAGSITGHTHLTTGPPPAPTGPGVGAAPPVTIDITAAKVSDVKLP